MNSHVDLRVFGRWIGLAGLLMVAPFAADTGAAPAVDSAPTLDSIRAKYNVAGLSVVVVKNGAICDSEVSGVRKAGDPTPVTTNDEFHLGSCSKPLTATLAAMFIDEGKLRWDSTIGEVFPELRGKINTNYESVTVEQLLTHRGGLPTTPPDAAWSRAIKQIGLPERQRTDLIAGVLTPPPAAPPGTKPIYSNLGYIIVAGMCEKIGGKPWETLMEDRLFKPLHMDSAGFGPPGTIGKVDQPWGHDTNTGALVGSQVDYPPSFSPSSRVHCSLDDLALFAISQMEGEKKGGLLKPETFAKMHTPPPGIDYTCGWGCVVRDWAGGRALTCNGSNGFWYMEMWLAPDKDFAVIVSANTGGNDSAKACDEVTSEMIKKWL